MTAASQRFTALDVFRGMTVCLMIIVNTPGNGATTNSPLLHAKWLLTPPDLVFPSFLFAVGNALSIQHKTNQTYFFEVSGRNPLFIYLLSELGATLLYFFRTDTRTTLYQWICENIFLYAGNYSGSFLFAVSVMLFCWLAGYF